MTIIGRRHRPAPLICFIAVICAACVAHAAPIVSESFDYSPAGSSLNGANGGTGFTGPWTSTNAPIVASTGLTHSLIFDEFGLGFTSLPTAGASPKRRIDASLFPASMKSGSSLGTSTDSGTLWITYLHHLDQDYSFIYLGNFRIGTTSKTSGYGIIDHTGGNTYALTPNQTNLVVIRVIFANTADQMTLWVNPVSLSNLTTANAVDSYTPGGNGLGDISIIQPVNAGAGDTAIWDEFRVGTDLLTLIPEPASLALLVTTLCVLLPAHRPAATCQVAAAKKSS